MFWKDCFGKELVVGEDVIIGITDVWNEPILHSGIVLTLDEEKCLITYNSWEGEIESTYNTTFYKFQYEDGIIKCVYKILNK